MDPDTCPLSSLVTAPNVCKPNESPNGIKNSRPCLAPGRCAKQEQAIFLFLLFLPSSHTPTMGSADQHDPQTCPGHEFHLFPSAPLPVIAINNIIPYESLDISLPQTVIGQNSQSHAEITKTRLVERWATALLKQFSNSVWFGDLAKRTETGPFKCITPIFSLARDCLLDLHSVSR